MESTLIIEIKNSKPIELLDLTKSLVSFANNFSNYVANHSNSHFKEAKLYVKEIKSGSVIVELIELVTPTLLPFVENSNTLLDFATHFKTVAQSILTGKIGENEPKATATELRDLAQILNPIANDSASQLNICTKIDGNIELHFHIDSKDSNALQNLAQKKLKELKTPEVIEDFQTKVVLTLYQARNDIKSNIGNKGIIQSLSDKALNLIFENDQDKETMLHSENLFTTAFVVDVQLIFANNKPAAYKISKIHETFDLE